MNPNEDTKLEVVEAANNSYDENPETKDNAESSSKDKAKSKVVSSHDKTRNEITFKIEFRSGNKGSDKINPHILFDEDNVGDFVPFLGKAVAARLFNSAFGHYNKILMHGNFKGSGDPDTFLARFDDPNFGLGRRSSGGSRDKIAKEVEDNMKAKLIRKLLGKGYSQEDAEKEAAELMAD